MFTSALPYGCSRHVSSDSELLVRLRLTPRDTSFFDLLAASAQHLVTGANLLGENYISTETKTYESQWGQQHATVLTNFAANILDGTGKPLAVKQVK